ncbi:MAG: glycosyltransferase family 4 protein [Candidatus Hermodarchaeota archaeon]
MKQKKLDKKMRIVHIVSYFQPQLGYEEYYVPKYQLSLGHDVFVVTSERYHPFPHYESIYEEILGSRFSPNIGFHHEEGIPTIRLPIIFELDSSVGLKHLRNTMKRLKPDIIHIHGFFFPIVLQTIINTPTSSKIVIDEHMIPPFPYILNIKNFLKAVYLKVIHKVLFKLYVQKRIHAIYVTKEEVSNYIEKKYNIVAPIIPLGVNTNIFDHSKYNSIALRENLGFKNDDFLLFYSGKLIRKKGLLTLIRIYNNLRQEGDNYGLLLIGSGPSKFVDFLKKRIEIQYHDKVKIIPFLNHTILPEYMSVGNLGCWIGEIPSASINEFLGMGKPVLVKVFEGKNLSTNGYNFALKYESVKESVNWIQSLANDSDLYQSICDNARNFAIQNLDWETTTRMILGIYNKAKET